MRKNISLILLFLYLPYCCFGIGRPLHAEDLTGGDMSIYEYSRGVQHEEIFSIIARDDLRKEMEKKGVQNTSAASNLIDSSPKKKDKKRKSPLDVITPPLNQFILPTKNFRFINPHIIIPSVSGYSKEQLSCMMKAKVDSCEKKYKEGEVQTMDDFEDICWWIDVLSIAIPIFSFVALGTLGTSIFISRAIDECLVQTGEQLLQKAATLGERQLVKDLTLEAFNRAEKTAANSLISKAIRKLPTDITEEIVETGLKAGRPNLFSMPTNIIRKTVTSEIEEGLTRAGSFVKDKTIDQFFEKTVTQIIPSAIASLEEKSAEEAAEAAVSQIAKDMSVEVKSFMSDLETNFAIKPETEPMQLRAAFGKAYAQKAIEPSNTTKLVKAVTDETDLVMRKNLSSIFDADLKEGIERIEGPEGITELQRSERLEEMTKGKEGALHALKHAREGGNLTDKIMTEMKETGMVKFQQESEKFTADAIESKILRLDVDPEAAIKRDLTRPAFMGENKPLLNLKEELQTTFQKIKDGTLTERTLTESNMTNIKENLALRIDATARSVIKKECEDGVADALIESFDKDFETVWTNEMKDEFKSRMESAFRTEWSKCIEFGRSEVLAPKLASFKKFTYIWANLTVFSTMYAYDKDREEGHFCEQFLNNGANRDYKN